MAIVACCLKRRIQMQFNPTMHKLSNGVTVLLDPMDLETTNVKVRFCTGGRDERPDEYGITHFCEHMLCKGTPRFPTQKFRDEYMDLNAGTRNAGTGMAGLAFYGRILAENLHVLIDYLGDQLQNSLFAKDMIELERKVVLDELRRYQDDEGDQFWDFIETEIFDGRSTSARRIIGTAETIESFTRDQMLEFLSRRLSAKNCIIGISGKISDAEKTLADLEKSFGWLKPFDVFENAAINYTPTVAHNSKSDKKNVRLRIFFPNIWDSSYEKIFQRMCVGKFERFLKEKMYEILRRENGLVYGFSMTGAGNETFGVTGFSTQTSVENLEKCVALMAKLSHQIYNSNEITNDDLERFRRKNRLADADWLESAGRRCDKLIGFYRDYGLIYDFAETIKLSDSITRDDVIKNSRGFFDGSISIMTQGANHNLDLEKIWKDNFN
jgi:predicted Zn-dependent peptidase